MKWRKWPVGPMALKVSMALRSWATGAVESCTTGLMTVSSKLVGVGTLQEEEEGALTVRYASSGSSARWEGAVSLLRLSL